MTKDLIISIKVKGGNKNENNYIHFNLVTNSQYEKVSTYSYQSKLGSKIRMPTLTSLIQHNIGSTRAIRQEKKE